jgi:hypothetical protein
MAEASSEDLLSPQPESDSLSVDESLAVGLEALTITPPASSEKVCPSLKPRRKRQSEPMIVAPIRRSLTPTRAISGRPSARRLFTRPRTPPPRWSSEESKQLVEVLLNTEGSAWVLHKDMRFWNEAGKFLQQSLGTAHCRSAAWDGCIVQPVVHVCCIVRVPCCVHDTECMSCKVCFHMYA